MRILIEGRTKHLYESSDTGNFSSFSKLCGLAPKKVLKLLSQICQN